MRGPHDALAFELSWARTIGDMSAVHGIFIKYFTDMFGGSIAIIKVDLTLWYKCSIQEPALA